MLKIKVLVNDDQIDEVNFWNVSQRYGIGKQKYKVFNAKMRVLGEVEHNYRDGYWELLAKILPKLKPKKMDKKQRDILDKIINQMLK